MIAMATGVAKAAATVMVTAETVTTTTCVRDVTMKSGSGTGTGSGSGLATYLPRIDATLAHGAGEAARMNVTWTTTTATKRT